VVRLEAGGVGATLTTLQKVAAALGLKITSNCPLPADPRSYRASPPLLGQLIEPGGVPRPATP